jgi:tRNA 2-selenouridine synthase
MTPLTLTSLADLQGLTADTIIDVRAPAEYADDHLPGAINLPVLSDAERAEVGTIYAKVSPFNARKIGGALVAQNTATHLQGPLAGKDGAWQPLVYCWRGGQRSGAFATILDQIGWRVQILKGGYRSYRREIVKTLYETPLPHRLMLISGSTGTARTAQPAQKMFESSIAAKLSLLDPYKITFVEAESSKIGERLIPPSLWALMVNSPRIEITATLDARSSFLCQVYADLTQDKAALSDLVDKLRPYHAVERIVRWHAQAQTGDWKTLAAGLMADHYDPRYAKSAALKNQPVHRVTLDGLDAHTLAKTADALHAQFSLGIV